MLLKIKHIASKEDLLAWARFINGGSYSLHDKCDLQDIYARSQRDDLDKFFIECEGDRKLVVPARHPYWLNDPEATKIPVGNRVFYVRELPPTIKKHRYGGGYFFDPPRGPLYDAPVRLETYHGGRKGFVGWDGPVLVPILTTPDGTANGKVWMSLTPMEVFSQRQGIGVAKGNVLIGGLGMGWFARRVLEKKAVKHVTVVWGDLWFNMRGYVGNLPLPGGHRLSIGERGISAYKSEIKQINREAK
jgi:hypothetical protein